MSYFKLKERLFQVFRPRTGSPALDGGARESLDSKVPPGPNAIASIQQKWVLTYISHFKNQIESGVVRIAPFVARYRV
jgi:hypothetical protein